MVLTPGAMKKGLFSIMLICGSMAVASSCGNNRGSASSDTASTDSVSTDTVPGTMCITSFMGCSSDVRDTTINGVRITLSTAPNPADTIFYRIAPDSVIPLIGVKLITEVEWPGLKADTVTITSDITRESFQPGENEISHSIESVTDSTVSIRIMSCVPETDDCLYYRCIMTPGKYEISQIDSRREYLDSYFTTLATRYMELTAAGEDTSPLLGMLNQFDSMLQLCTAIDFFPVPAGQTLTPQTLPAITSYPAEGLTDLQVVQFVWPVGPDTTRVYLSYEIEEHFEGCYDICVTGVTDSVGSPLRSFKDEYAVRNITRFMQEYMALSDENKDTRELIESVCTSYLRNRLYTNTPDCDPILNAQDVARASIPTVSVTPVAGLEQVYHAEYLWPGPPDTIHVYFKCDYNMMIDDITDSRGNSIL